VDAGVKLLCILVISKQQGLSEEKRMELEREWIGEMNQVDASVHYGKEIVVVDGGCQLQDKWIDGWLLSVHESRRESECESLLLAMGQDLTIADHSMSPIIDDASSPTIPMTALSRRTLLLGDKLCLAATTDTAVEPFIHVDTASAASALTQIVPSIQLGLPVMLSSSPSSGKTHILQYLCTQLYPASQPTHRILTIPLADTSIDVKSLIGTYISSTTKPGTFEWMEGALTKAVRAGRWVVFDDIDRASTEMLVTIAGITRSLRPGRHGRRAELPIPGRGKVGAGDGFAIFATRSTSLDAFSPAIFLGHQEYREVVLEAPTDTDIFAILSARYATLPAEIITPLVSIWQKLRPLAKISGQVKARSIGLRDLEKWCGRIERSNPPTPSSAGPFTNPAFQDEVMLEAADIFIASLDIKPSSLDKRMKMLRVVAEGIDMDEERALSLMDRRKPTLELAPSSRQLLIGRTNTPTAAPEKRRSNPAPSRPFALTKPSLVLLERVAAANATAEPLLLVGETGTGKTTAVQYIADTCRRPLTALNLSMQTESSDLLGGFKPIDASVAARAIHAKWQQLFCESFSMGKSTNGAYVEATAKALGGRKWARCADLWSTSAKRAVDKLSKPEQPTENGGDSPRKRRKVVNAKAAKLAVQWQSLLVEVADFDLHHVKMKSKLVFSFVEGPLVKALVSGEW
jgi:midasin